MAVSEQKSPHALIFGAGKIGRGFIAHLLHESNYQLSFVDVQEKIITLLNEYKEYPVVIMGAPEKNVTLPVADAWILSDMENVSEAIADSDVIFISVGGQNVALIGPVLAKGLTKRFERNSHSSLNIIICENYHQPGKIAEKGTLKWLDPKYHAIFRERVGIAETQIQRSVIEPTEEMVREHPLALKAQDHWILPVDADSLKPPVPEVKGFQLVENFQNALQRKLYTYNATNAVVCYLGYLKGYEFLADAANDPEIIEIVEKSWEESNPAIVKQFGYTAEEQHTYAQSALEKYQKREIVDPIERNARDPIRKLGMHDRLVGPASMAIESGIKPLTYAYVIAAALQYDYPDDARAQTLQAWIREKGLAVVLNSICGLALDSELTHMIEKRYHDFKDSKKTGSLPSC